MTDIAPDDSALVYSPYTWLVQPSGAKTINSGASVRTIVTATTCALNLGACGATAPSVLWARLDAGAWQQIPLSGSTQSVALTMPSANTSGSHLLEVVVKGTSQFSTRWTPQLTAVTLTGLTLSAGGTVRAPQTLPRRLLIYGDSITEGVFVNGSSQASEIDRYDALLDYALATGRDLSAEVGVVGFGGTGWATSGGGGVPSLPSTYNFLWSGQARSFSPLPDLVIYLHGANDGSASAGTVQANAQTVIAALLALGITKHLVLRPLGGTQASAIQAAVSATSNANVVYVDTTGWFTAGTDAVDGVHPYGFAHLGLIAPRVVSAARTLLGSAGLVRVGLGGGLAA